MNEQPNTPHDAQPRDDKLRDVVERSTMAGNRLPASLDGETASLRHAWLQFGKLIEQEMQLDDVHGGANAGIEQAGTELAEFGLTLAARPCGEVAAAGSVERSENPVGCVGAAARRRHPAWSIALVAAAASLLLAVGAAIAIHFTSDQQQPNLAGIAASGSNGISPAQPMPAGSHQPESNIDPESLLAVSEERLLSERSVSKGLTMVSRATMVLAVPLSIF